MKLILDNNILFSVMNPHSMNSLLFSILNIKFFAPSFIIEEFKKYEKEACKKSKLSSEKFNQRKKLVFSKVSFVNINSYKKFIKPAEKFCPDENDIFYFALALKLRAPLWSNDKELKNQEKVVVLDTEDIINIYLN